MLRESRRWLPGRGAQEAGRGQDGENGSPVGWAKWIVGWADSLQSTCQTRTLLECTSVVDWARGYRGRQWKTREKAVGGRGSGWDWRLRMAPSVFSESAAYDEPGLRRADQRVSRYVVGVFSDKLPLGSNCCSLIFSSSLSHQACLGIKRGEMRFKWADLLASSVSPALLV